MEEVKRSKGAIVQYTPEMEAIPEWIAIGRGALFPKTENLSPVKKIQVYNLFEHLIQDLYWVDSKVPGKSCNN